MFQIVLGFLPWIVFSFLFGKTNEESIIAVVIALFILIVIDFKSLKKGFVLTWSGLIFFPCILLLTVIWHWNWAANNASFISNIALSLITWISLLIGKPFTLQYARERAPKESWFNPTFIAINRQLTTFWGLIFTVTVMVHFISFKNETYTTLIQQIISYGSMFLGIWLSNNYPKWYISYFKSKS